MTDKSEAKPSTTSEEVHELDRLREEGLRRNPSWQTGNIDTSTGVTDLGEVSPIFKQAQEAAIRRAADHADSGEEDPRVVLPEGEDAAQRALDDAQQRAADLPTAEEEAAKREEAERHVREAQDEVRNEGTDDKEAAKSSTTAKSETKPAASRSTRSTSK
jgi:membrane protein involved in colicin uptake